MSNSFSQRVIKVNGVAVEIDTDVELGIDDISVDIDRVASQMGYWASVWAAAVREQGEADAHYRAWRGRKAMALLGSDQKMAEWKVNAGIESDPQFLALKSAIAKADENVVLTKGMFESFAKKANTLQSKGAMDREIYRDTGLHTPAEPRAKRSVPAPKRPEDDDKKSAVRAVFKKK